MACKRPTRLEERRQKGYDGWRREKRGKGKENKEDEMMNESDI